MIERQWESLAQSGVQLDVGTPSPVDKMHSVYLYGRGQQMWFQYHDSPSMHWERVLCVSGAKNKKEAKLLAKKEILEDVLRLKVVGTDIIVRVHRAAPSP